MNNLKENPRGLDVVIHTMQVKLYDELSSLWSTTLEGYPRCYSIKRDARRNIEHYIGRGEYVSLIHAEGNKFFTLAGDSIDYVSNTHYKTTIELFFILNLDTIYNGIYHRADEEVRVDVLNILNKLDGVQVMKVETLNDRVFMGYNYNVGQNLDFTNDIQPYHCFKLIIDILEYDINEHICNN